MASGGFTAAGSAAIQALAQSLSGVSTYSTAWLSATAATAAAHPVGAVAASLVLLLAAFLVRELALRPYLQHRYYGKKQGMPSLPFRPVVGNLPELREFQTTPYSNRVDKLLGPVYYMFLGPRIRVSLNHPELAKEVLVTKADAFRKVSASCESTPGGAAKRARRALSRQA